MNDHRCPCCSGQNYNDCCGPYLSGDKTPATPEQLMRSRYSAYANADADYIFSTMQGSALKRADREETKRWAASVEWLKLEVLAAPPANADQGMVEFIAYYREQGLEKTLHECSQFIKKNQRWYYIDGKQLNSQAAKQTPKTGRNDPCPCGSGKKFKKCCQ